MRCIVFRVIKTPIGEKVDDSWKFENYRNLRDAKGRVNVLNSLQSLKPKDPDLILYYEWEADE